VPDQPCPAVVEDEMIRRVGAFVASCTPEWALKPRREARRGVTARISRTCNNLYLQSPPPTAPKPRFARNTAAQMC
jgi:hypothetical protein